MRRFSSSWNRVLMSVKRNAMPLVIVWHVSARTHRFISLVMITQLLLCITPAIDEQSPEGFMHGAKRAHPRSRRGCWRFRPPCKDTQTTFQYCCSFPCQYGVTRHSTVAVLRKQGMAVANQCLSGIRVLCARYYQLIARVCLAANFRLARLDRVCWCTARTSCP